MSIQRGLSATAGLFSLNASRPPSCPPASGSAVRSAWSMLKNTPIFDSRTALFLRVLAGAPVITAYSDARRCWPSSKMYAPPFPRPPAPRVRGSASHRSTDPDG